MGIFKRKLIYWLLYRIQLFTGGLGERILPVSQGNEAGGRRQNEN